MRKKNPKEDKAEIYKYFFHESRFPIIESQLSQKNAKKFRKLSNESKALFINFLIKEGVLSW